ncbi:MAG: response regulator [Microscillaceae bacterium]|nr:response regulator [Microscillaceae bacterium]
MKKINCTLVVEDDAITTLIIKKTLEKHTSFDKIYTAKNGREALDWVQACAARQETLPNLILLDLNMPVMDGWEFLEAFKIMTLAQKVGIIILSSSIDQADLERARTYSLVKGYFAKPLTEEKLDETLEIMNQFYTH